MASWRQVAETHVHVAGLSKTDAKDATTRDLVALGLDGREARRPGQLSGGMAQRVAFAAATAGKAPILLADEPTKGLDSDRRDKVVGLLGQVPDAGGTLLAITHEAFVARKLGGRLIVLRDGDVVEEGDTREVLAAPSADYTRALMAADPGNWSKVPSAEQGKPLLTARGLSVGRGGTALIEGLDLTIHEGERIALTGPSGIGKSTLLDVLAGLIKPLAGSIQRAGELGPCAVQKLYQDPPAAFPKHVHLHQTLRDVASLHGMPWDRVMAHLEDLNLAPALLERRPDAVSGGELQRLSIVRALAAGPGILLADEPTSRLDPITQKETLDLIAGLSLQKRLAVVLVTHDTDLAAAWADRVVELNSVANLQNVGPQRGMQ